MESIENTLRREEENNAEGKTSASGHIYISEGETMDFEAQESKAKQELLNVVELKRKARQIQVSTDDYEVKAYLRELGEPICLYGEDAADRRERLRQVLAIRGESGIRKKQEEERKLREEENKVWYHEGSESLKAARLYIAKYSLPRAKQRLDQARAHYASVPESQRKARAQELHKLMRTTMFECSQIGDDSHPLSYCSFSPSGSQLATASWSGNCKVWSVPDCQLMATLSGHTAQADCVVWHPRATLDDTQIALASSAHDGSVKLWSSESVTPLADIEGHAPHRVPRMAFHPSGRFLATCCYDSSWRLWDLEVCEEILHQEGHSQAVYDVAFHKDGSLALTGGLDSFGRVWDLRTGRCIMFLEGHLEGILAVSFADNGVHMATASLDNTVRLWDLRQHQCVYTLPAHKGVVTTVKFQPGDSHYLLTASNDKKAKLWGHPVWTPIKELTAHEGRVMNADISPDCQFVATCSSDRTFKLWTPEK